MKNIFFVYLLVETIHKEAAAIPRFVEKKIYKFFVFPDRSLIVKKCIMHILRIH